MVWAPKYFAVQEEGIIDNALFIITRDFKAALDTFYTIEATLDSDDPNFLEDFQERALGQIFRNNFPCLAIGPTRTVSVESDGGDRLKEAIKMDIYMGVVADTAANVTTKIMRYVGTMNLVLRSARKSDWKRNMSVQSFGVVVDDIDHVYGPIRDRESIYFRDAVMQVTILINER